MTENRLAPELVSLVHHVTLNESGWWKKAVRRMIIAAIWVSGRPLSCPGIAEVLDTEFQVQLGEPVLETQIAALRSEQVLVGATKNGEVTVAQDRLREFEAELETSRIEADKAREHFGVLMTKYCGNLDAQTVWDDFNSNFLLPMIRSIGANTYRLVTGEESIQESAYLDDFLHKYEEKHTDGLRRTLSDFFSPTNPFTRGYILKYLNVYFFVEAAKIPTATLALIETSQQKRPRLRLFLDTNFLFSVLGLHENPADTAAVTLLNLSGALKEKVDLRLYVIPDTIDEAKRVIGAVSYSLTKIGVPNNVASAALHSQLSGIVAKYFDVSKRSDTRISPQEYFAPYVDNLVAILKGKSIEVYAGPTQHMHTSQKVVDDILAQLEREETKPGNKQKSYESLQHDMTLWHVVYNLRSPAFESPLEIEDWIITLDYRLLGFDRYKQHLIGRHIPVCLHPTTLIQRLQFWVPMSTEVQENILNSMRLPLVFHQFDALDEAVTLKIVRAISRYENAGDLPEETIRAILVDQALRARIAEDVPENEQIALVREALIEQHQRTEAQLVDAQKKIEELNSEAEQSDNTLQKLTKELSQSKEQIKTLEETRAQERQKLEEIEAGWRKEQETRELVSERLTRLEETYVAETELRKYKVKAIFLPATVLVIVNVLIHSKFIEKGTISAWQVIAVFSLVYGLGWLYWLIHAGQKSTSVSKWHLYRSLIRVSKSIYWILGLVVAGVIAHIVAKYWDEILNWVAQVIEIASTR